MAGNIDPIFSKVGQIDGGVVLTTAANDYNGQNINNAVVATSDATNGGFFQRLRFKAIGTNVASVARLYINNGLGRLASSVAAVVGTPTGTPSGSGGTLLTGSLFARIVAIDQFGAPTAASTETASVSVTGPTGQVTWNWTAVTGAASYAIFVGPVTGGQLTYFTSSTNSYVQTTATSTNRDSLNGFLINNYFMGEVSLPATTIIATAATTDIDYPLNYALPAGYRVVVGLGTTVAAGWHVTAVGGKY